MPHSQKPIAVTVPETTGTIPADTIGRPQTVTVGECTTMEAANSRIRELREELVAVRREYGAELSRRVAEVGELLGRNAQLEEFARQTRRDLPDVLRRWLALMELFSDADLLPDAQRQRVYVRSILAWMEREDW